MARAREYGVDAPWSTAREHQIQECETIVDRRFALVDDRRKRSWKVLRKVRDGHFAREDERDGSRQKAQDDGDATNGFDERRGAEHRCRIEVVARHWHWRNADELLRPVLEKHQPNDDSKNTQHSTRPAR